MLQRILSILLFVVCVVHATAAYAGPQEEADALYKKGVTAYDDLDFDAARTWFEKAIKIIVTVPNKVNAETTANVYVHAGILYFSVDKDSAKAQKAFVNALKANPSITIDPALSNPNLEEVFTDAKEMVVGVVAVAPTGPMMLSHKKPREVTSDTPMRIKVDVPEGISAARVTVFYRNSNQSKFTELNLDLLAANTYQINIPSTQIRGEFIEYYIIAFDGSNQRIGLSGDPDAPHKVDITSTELDPEGATPGSKKKKPQQATDPEEGSEEGSEEETPRPKKKKSSSNTHFFSAIVRAGTGAGIVTGTTDSGLKLNYGVGQPEFVLIPELALHIRPNFTMGAIGRIQLTGRDPNLDPVPPMMAALRLRFFTNETKLGFRPYIPVEGGFGKVAQRFPIQINGEQRGDDTEHDAGPMVGVGWGFEADIAQSLAITLDGTFRGYFDLADQFPLAQFDLALGFRLGN